MTLHPVPPFDSLAIYRILANGGAASRRWQFRLLIVLSYFTLWQTAVGVPPLAIPPFDSLAIYYILANGGVHNCANSAKVDSFAKI